MRVRGEVSASAERICACPSESAGQCVRIRYNVSLDEYMADPEPCSCFCHEDAAADDIDGIYDDACQDCGQFPFEVGDDSRCINCEPHP